MTKDPLIFLNHILESIENIEEFIKEVSRDSFIENKEKYSAVIRQIETIGEAVKNLPDYLKERYTNISWKEIAGTRDKMIHHYFGVDLDIVWEISQKDLPELKKDIQVIIEDIKKIE